VPQNLRITWGRGAGAVCGGSLRGAGRGGLYGRDFDFEMQGNTQKKKKAR